MAGSVGCATNDTGQCFLFSANLNLALNKPVYQSSTGYSGPAEQAVDGNSATNYYAWSCSHTNYEDGAWFAVDLGETYSVETIRITTRSDCCRKS